MQLKVDYVAAPLLLWTVGLVGITIVTQQMEPFFTLFSQSMASLLVWLCIFTKWMESFQVLEPIGLLRGRMSSSFKMIKKRTSLKWWTLQYCFILLLLWTVGLVGDCGCRAADRCLPCFRKYDIVHVPAMRIHKMDGIVQRSSPETDWRALRRGWSHSSFKVYEPIIRDPFVLRAHVLQLSGDDAQA
jgi:hypothetical protein